MCEETETRQSMWNCGPDDLCAEHLLYAHPILIMHLKVLFKLILCHRFVPNSFGKGVTVPLIKDKTDNINDVSNYGGITLSPVISKLFEVVLLSICSDVLEIDSLQVGFKDKIGAAGAIFFETDRAPNKDRQNTCVIHFVAEKVCCPT